MAADNQSMTHTTDTAVTTNHTAAHYGREAAKRLGWITGADYRNSLVCDLFPGWERSAVAYAIAAAHAARGEY